jgi:hypothetical protein
MVPAASQEGTSQMDDGAPPRDGRQDAGQGGRDARARPERVFSKDWFRECKESMRMDGGRVCDFNNACRGGGNPIAGKWLRRGPGAGFEEIGDLLCDEGGEHGAESLE